MIRMLQRVGRRGAPVCAAVAIGLVATACGGGGAKVSAATTTPTTANSRQAALQAYRDCLAQHGVNLAANAGFRGGARGPRPTDQGGAPETRPPTTLPPGVTQAQFDAARNACQSKLPAGGFGGFGGRGSPAFQAYLSCLRDHGVPVPTTTPGAQQGPPPSMDRSSPAFQSANAVCRALLPNRTGGSTTTAPQS